MLSQSSLDLIALVATCLGLFSGVIMMTGGLVLIIYDILDQVLP